MKSQRLTTKGLFISCSCHEFSVVLCYTTAQEPSSRRLHHLEAGTTWNMSVATIAGKKRVRMTDMIQLELLKWLHQTAKGLENSLSVCPGRKRGLDMSERQYLYYYSVGKENETRWQAFRLEPCTQQVVNNWQLLVFLLYVNWGISFIT